MPMPTLVEKQEQGDGQNGGWLRSHVEAPMCEAFFVFVKTPVVPPQRRVIRLILRKLAPHFTHIEPSPIFHRSNKK